MPPPPSGRLKLKVREIRCGDPGEVAVAMSRHARLLHSKLRDEVRDDCRAG